MCARELPAVCQGAEGEGGGVRSPLYIAELDPEKLRRAKRLRNTYYYDAETIDPRYLDAAVSPTA